MYSFHEKNRNRSQMQYFQRNRTHQQFNQRGSPMRPHDDLIATETLGQLADRLGHMPDLGMTGVLRARGVEQVTRCLQLLVAFILVKQDDLLMGSKTTDIMGKGRLDIHQMNLQRFRIGVTRAFVSDQRHAAQ